MKNQQRKRNGAKCLMTVSIIHLRDNITILTSAELQLIHKALFDPYDQSLWFYHQNLMSTFDPALSSQTMAPQLTDGERLEYITNEREFILEVLEDAQDCKWVYQALIECSLVRAKVKGELSAADRREVRTWLAELTKLDPLR